MTSKAGWGTHPKPDPKLYYLYRLKEYARDIFGAESERMVDVRIQEYMQGKPPAQGGEGQEGE